jgi:hypothetical protein
MTHLDKHAQCFKSGGSHAYKDPELRLRLMSGTKVHANGACKILGGGGGGGRRKYLRYKFIRRLRFRFFSLWRWGGGGKTWKDRDGERVNGVETEVFVMS